MGAVPLVAEDSLAIADECRFCFPDPVKAVIDKELRLAIVRLLR